MGLKLILATSNVHKVTELRNLLPGSYELGSLSETGNTESIPETGKTFTENALQKARFVYNRYSVNSLADDSGLVVDALNGAPGIYSARFAGEQANSSDNIGKLMDLMKDKPNRTARFVAVLALIIEGKEYVFEGVCEGTIADKVSGKEGFGYDPVFIPQRYDQTFAELGADVKNAISHRAVAVQKLVAFLNSLNN